MAGTIASFRNDKGSLMHRSRWGRLGRRTVVQVAACFELTLCCQASKICKGSTEAFGPRHTTGLYSWPRGRQPDQATVRSEERSGESVLVQSPHHISRLVLPRVGLSALFQRDRASPGEWFARVEPRPPTKRTNPRLARGARLPNPAHSHDSRAKRDLHDRTRTTSGLKAFRREVFPL